jgi:hypothetical protein
MYIGQQVLIKRIITTRNWPRVITADLPQLIIRLTGLMFQKYPYFPRLPAQHILMSLTTYNN